MYMLIRLKRKINKMCIYMEEMATDGSGAVTLPGVHMTI